MAKDIKFNIKLQIDGKEHIVSASTNTKELAKQLNIARDAATRFGNRLIEFNQYADALRNISESVSRFAAGMRQVVQANAQVTQSTGLAGDEMLRLRNSVQAVSDYFGTGFSETLQAANALSKGFGITAEEAMRLVRDGMVSGANANGQFLDTLREYPRYFKEAGLSAEAFVAVTANAAMQGVFSDKGVDAIKEANIRLREMTPATQAALDGIGISSAAVMQALQDGSTTTFQVMQQVAARLAELPPSASAVGTAIADIFGGPGEDAGLEYIKTLATVETSMERVKAAAGETAAQQERTIQMQERMKNALSSVIDLSSLYARVQPFVETAAQAGMAVSGISGLAGVLKSTNIQYAAYRARTLAARAANILLWRSASAAASATAGMGAAMRTSSVAATRLATALRAAFITTGIGIVIAGVTAAIAALTSETEKAKEATGGFGQAEDAAREAAASAKVEIDNDAKALRALIDAKADATEAVQRLNDKYGSSFGTYQTAAEWYDTLTTKAREYALAIGYAAKMESLGKQLAGAEVELQMNRDRQQQLIDTGQDKEESSALVSRTDPVTGTYFENVKVMVDTDEMKELREQEEAINDGIAALNKELEATQALAANAAKALGAVTVNPEPGKGGDPEPGTPIPAAVNPGAATIAEMQGNVEALRALQADASKEEIAGINQSIALWEAKIRVMKRAGLAQQDALSPKGAKDMDGLSNLLEGEQRAVDQTSIAWEGYSLSQGKAKEEAPALNEQLALMSGAMRNLGGAVGGQAAEWLNWGATLLGSIAQALPAIAQLIGGNIAQAFAGGIAQSQTVMFPGNIIALAATLAAVGAAVASIPKFAEGGIAYGPTLGLFGEYAGAGSNPEVVAPLDRLRELVRPEQPAFGEVRFTIQGDNLAGVLERHYRKTSRR